MVKIETQKNEFLQILYLNLKLKESQLETGIFVMDLNECAI